MARYYLPSLCGAGRKPVELISDRAKRYRANRPECRPEGPKKCQYCRSVKNLGVHHRDGDESNGRRSNLAWCCKRCNAWLAHRMKAAGKGVRTRQLNPAAGASSFDQWASAVAAIDAERGGTDSISFMSADEARALIHATPAARRRRFQQEAWSIRKSRYGPSGRKAGGGILPF